MFIDSNEKFYMRKYTKEIFIEKAIERYGEQYVHDKVVYINSQTKVCVICPEHGEFYIRPADYLRGYGCPKCGNLRKSKKLSLSQDEVINRFIEKHGNIYDYSRVNYKNMNTKVDILCEKHGIFEMTPSNHLQGQGCPKCNGIHLTTEDIINEFCKIHGDKYDYSLTKYHRMHEKVTVICPEHGKFQITPSKHRLGQGCPKCGMLKKARNQSYDDETLIKLFKEIHKDKYIYDKTKLNGNLHNRITVTCPIHGDFEQIAQSHLQGYGCKKCRTSKLEEQIKDFLLKENINFEQQKTFNWLKHKNHLYLDFYLPDYNIAIECQGEQHYRPINFFGGEEYFIKTIERDETKYKLCREHCIDIIYFSNNDNYKGNFSIIKTLEKLRETLYNLKSVKKLL